MKTKNRVLSLLLAVLMFTSVFAAFPPIIAEAAAPNGSIAIPKVGFIGEKFVIEGTVTSNGSPIDIVNIAVYKDSTQTVGVWCFRKEGLNASSFNFKTKAKLFEWGDEIESVNPNSTNPPFDTGAYSSVYVEVIVKAKDGTTTKKTGTVQIINVSKSDLDFSSAGGDKTFKITASSNWTVTDDKTWISVSPSSGSSSKTITVSCSNNTSTSSREGTVTVTHSSSGETYTIDVYQDGKETNPAEFFGDIDFPDTIKDGEDFAFGGAIEVENSPISIVNIGLYSDSTMETGITYYRNENVNSYSFDFNDAIPSFEWGDTLATVNSNSTNHPFDTSKYDRAYFVVTVKAKEGESKTYTHWVTVEETVISGSVNTTTDLRLGETFSFSGTVRSEGSPISVINIGMYADSTMNVGITYYRNENINSNAFDFSYVDTFVWGASLKTVNSNSANPPFETAKYSQVYFLITVKTADGEFVQYEKWVNATNHQLLGDLNGDSEITNKDRFLLNRYLANMAGYTNINKIVADINGDGNVTDDDAVILERHLFGWIGYEDLDVFHNTTTVPPTNVPKWDMSFSSNAVTIELVLKEGTLEKNKNYLFIAENSKGLHYTGIIEAGQTSASFSVKAMQMPRGEMYSYYIIPEGLVLAGNKDTYCIGKSVVPLFKGNMITSVKSGDRTIAKNGYIFIGDGLTINWDGSYGVDNFKLVVTLNGSEIYSKTFNHDGPGTVTISADKISSKGTGTLIVSGYVEPSSASGLATAVSVWTGNVVETEKTVDSEVDPVDLLNEDALALYNKSEAVAYLQLETYYYWQAFADELNSGRYWESYRSDISNIVNGLFSSPTTLIFDSNAKALIKQAVRTKLLQETKSENALFTSISTYYKDVTSLLPSTVNNIAIPGIVAIFKSGQSIGGDKQNDIILMLAKKIDYRTVNTQNVDKILNVLNNTSVNYNGTTYYLSQFYNINHDTAFELKVQLGAIKKAETVSDQMALIENSKKTYAINADKIDTTNSAGQKLDKILKAVEWTGRGVFHLNDMCSLWALSNQFDEYEKLLNEMVASSDGAFKEAIQETIFALRKEAYLQVLAETAWDTIRLAVDEIYGEVVVKALQKNPYVLLATVSNGIFTTLANTDAVNKGELTLPHIVEAMNDTISKIEYTYSLFMMNPTNARYYELESLFHTYQFQVELGAEIYMNLSLADHNSYLKRFVRFINPFDKEDKMPETIQGCYDEDIRKLNYVLTWFGFN